MAGIYVHIPFCTAKCAYCDFFSVPRLQLVENVVRAIGREWMLRKPEIERPETLYIGGGTPSLLSSESFTTLTEQLPALPLTEFTVEVNPDDVVADKAGAWLQAGVNRISMGVQSFCDDELNAVGRRHSAATAINAYRFLRNIGFNNLSLDLIYGLPGQTLRSWKYSVDTLLAMTLTMNLPITSSDCCRGHKMWYACMIRVSADAATEQCLGICYSLNTWAAAIW